MNAKSGLLLAFLAVVIALPTFGWSARVNTLKAEMKQTDPSAMMGKPTVDVIVDGLHMKVWLMTQAQHKEMMKGKMGRMGRNDTSTRMGTGMKEMKRGGMQRNMAMRDSMMAGTHHIMLEAIDTASGKGVEDASVKVLIMSPSKKESSVDLVPMMRHFGGALTLDEKGEYHMTVDVKSAGVTKTAQFLYTVK